MLSIIMLCSLLPSIYLSSIYLSIYQPVSPSLNNTYYYFSIIIEPSLYSMYSFAIAFFFSILYLQDSFILLQVVLAHSFSLLVITSWCEQTDLFILVSMNTQGFPEYFSTTNMAIMNIPVRVSCALIHFFFSGVGMCL